MERESRGCPDRNFPLLAVTLHSSFWAGADLAVVGFDVREVIKV